VILNNQTAMSGLATDETDISAVNSSNIDISALAYNYTPDKLALYDDTAGRIEHTVIAEIAADAGQNNVYIVNQVHGTEVDPAHVWKIRISRSGENGYSLQYAKIDDSEFQTAEIQKNGSTHFAFFSFTEGNVQV